MDTKVCRKCGEYEAEVNTLRQLLSDSAAGLELVCDIQFEKGYKEGVRDAQKIFRAAIGLVEEK